ncbi:PREDICTED: auxilin-related protein 2-like isoform X1 [Lupinus angustifolius]|uniref:auxilin-related protein 2-like isoform X1 n=1 Tax=Lupinus angustifolius TaxID=3871 RepID=UPI00092E88B0|nr:PREDICTED: auxilin-related protein 2-like isoform X1 [Lupinus angustifolius]
MNNFDNLLSSSDFGFKPKGKSAPMAPSSNNNINDNHSSNLDFGSRSSNRNNRDADGFGDLFGGASKSDAPFNLDSMFTGSGSSAADFGSRSANSPPPVYDKPVYDDDIFHGVPGVKTTFKVQYDDVFASDGGRGGGSDRSGAFDDLLGGFGKESKSSGGKRLEKDEKGVSDFDDLLAGFGTSARPSSSERHTPDIHWSSEPTASGSKRTSAVAEDPFKVFESPSAPKDSPASHFADPLEEISKFSSSGSTKYDSTSNSNGRVYEDIDPFDGLGKSVPAFSSEGNGKKVSSSPRSSTSTSWTRDKEPVEKLSGRSPSRSSQNKIPVEQDQDFPQVPIYTPTNSSDSNKPVDRRSTSPSYNAGFKQTNIQVDMSPKYEQNMEWNEDIWLTVSEIPLFTQPTTAPPPSRPPPPRPVHIPKSGTGSPASKNARKMANEFSSFPSSTRLSHGPNSAPAVARVSPVSQFDEHDDFSMGMNRGNDDESGNGLHDEELEMNSAAAAMKEAMDRAQAKFRHAKEVRERENTKASRNKEAVQLKKDDRTMLEEREKQEMFDRERQQKEREEEEQRRVMKEREVKEREQQMIEREKARQAVERATREARGRAAAEAHQKAQRAAVGKAHAEARERAERAAVQRAQAEARERAAAEAKERAERAAAEAKEKETRVRAARAEAEARVKAERAAVERAAAEARERAAVEARDRAAAAARMNQQNNENDLESFFGMGERATSVPRPPRANSSDSVFETQFQSDATRKSTAASPSMKKASSATNIVDDLSSIFGAAPSSGEFQEVEGESEERRRARLERHQRSQERVAKALAEKNQRDLQSQREQAERHRLGETLDFEIKRWATGKEGNLRALLSTLQYVLWPECGWQPVSLTDLITPAAVKKAYRKATLCIHPDKVQQKGATLQQKYIAEKVFDLLKEAWNKLNSEELF